MKEKWIDYAIQGELKEMRKIHKELKSQGLQGDLKNWKDSYGETALMKASRHGHHKICKWLVAENLVDENAKNIFGWNALHLAVEHKRPEIAQLLLKETSIDINQKTNDGYTALRLASTTSTILCTTRRTALSLKWKSEFERILDLEIYFRKNIGKSTN